MASEQTSGAMCGFMSAWAVAYIAPMSQDPSHIGPFDYLYSEVFQVLQGPSTYFRPNTTMALEYRKNMQMKARLLGFVLQQRLRPALAISLDQRPATNLPMVTFPTQEDEELGFDPKLVLGSKDESKPSTVAPNVGGQQEEPQLDVEPASFDPALVVDSDHEKSIILSHSSQLLAKAHWPMVTKAEMQPLIDTLQTKRDFENDEVEAVIKLASELEAVAQQTQVEEAQTLLTNAVSSSLTIHTSLYSALGRMYSRFGELKGCAINLGVCCNWRDHSCCVGLGDCHLRANDYGEAASAYQQALELDFSRSASHNMLAVSYMFAGKDPEAEAAFARGVEVAPDDYGIRFNYAKLLVRMKKFPDAARELRAALATKPDYTAATDLLREVHEAIDGV